MTDPTHDDELSKIRLLHIHGQSEWHRPAHIVANRAGLEALLGAISKALGKPGHAQEVTAHCADGEGYRLAVELLDQPFGAPAWEKRALPYTSEIAREPGDRLP